MHHASWYTEKNYSFMQMYTFYWLSVIGLCVDVDRWGNTALQEAIRCNQGPAVQLLTKYTDYKEML